MTGFFAALRMTVNQKNPELVRVGILVELEYEILAA